MTDIDGWSSCNFKGGLLQAPLNPLKADVSRGRQVFQVGQAPSGPTVIWPLVNCSWSLNCTYMYCLPSNLLPHYFAKIKCSTIGYSFAAQ